MASLKNDSPADSNNSGCLLAFFKLFRSGKTKPNEPSLPYQKKDWFFSQAERSFFGVLQNAVGERYHIFAKVRLIDLVFVRKGTASRQTHQNKVQSKHIDFVLCDRKTIQPVLLIELDDASHEREDRQERDAFVDAALQAAGLPILHIPAKRGYSPQELVQRISEKVTIA